MYFIIFKIFNNNNLCHFGEKQKKCYKSSLYSADTFVPFKNAIEFNAGYTYQLPVDE